MDADLENSMLLVSGTGNSHIVIWSMRVGGRRMFLDFDSRWKVMYCSYDLNSKVMKIILGYEDVMIAVILYNCIGMSIFGQMCVVPERNCFFG